jgi:hypothetical protein
MSERRARTGKDERSRVAHEAARVMYEEGVSQYFDAKRLAARRVLGNNAARYRPGALPSNGEIRDALLALVSLAEGEDRTRRLFAMRVEALVLLRELERWSPRLIGSVWSGHPRRGSDVDLHLFGDLDAICEDLRARGWRYEHDVVGIRVAGGFQEYHHLHLAGRPFPVELSVYDERERRTVTRSSVDGRPIDRVSAARLEQRLRDEHGAAFAAWEAGDYPPFEERPTAGAFDALLTRDDDG